MTDLGQLGRRKLGVVHKHAGIPIHPYSWLDIFADRYFGPAVKASIAKPALDMRWVALRLPVISKGIPRPSPSNWIDLGGELPKKSGLEKFILPTAAFTAPLSSAQMWGFLDLMLHPEQYFDLVPDASPIRFVKSPSIEFLEHVLEFSDSLLRERQFLPCVPLGSSRAVMAVPEWRSILGRRETSLVRKMIENGPGEFFSAVSLSPRAGVTAPVELIHRVVDGIVSASVRELASSTNTFFDYDNLESKPIDDLIFSLTTPKWGAPNRVSTQGRIPELLNEWRARLLTRLEPMHLAMRLSPPGLFDHPDGKSDEWEVALGLVTDGGGEEFIDSLFFDREEKLLEEMELTAASAELVYLRKLQAAAKHSPEIAELLKSSYPSRIYLSSEAVFDFVSQTAPLLGEEEGALLILPNALKDSLRPRIKISSSPSRSGVSMLGLGAIFSFKPEVFLGDRKLDSSEIAKLLKANSPVVKVGSDWVFLDQAGLTQALRYLERHKGRSEMSLAELIGDSLEDIGLEGSVVVERPDPAALVESLRLARSLGPQEFAEPDGFMLPLRDYQRRGVEWLASLEQLGLGGCLADDMGLGKTAQVIALMAMERAGKSENELGTRIASPPAMADGQEISDTAATLIVAPVSVVNNWRHEIERFYPFLRVHIHHGAKRLNGSEFLEIALAADVVITSYSLLARDSDLLTALSWRRIVLDEAQNVKNPTTAMARAAASLKGLSRIALTGTPVENHTGELWSIMNFINPSLLGARARFRQRFSIPIERGGDTAAMERLARNVAPFILRRLKTDKSIIRDLPEKIEIKEYCTLSDEQVLLYKAAVDKLKQDLAEASNMQRRGSILATITKLKQICNHPNSTKEGTRLTGSSGKLDRLEELLDEILENREKAIIFTQFATFGNLLQHHLQDRFSMRVPFLSGSVAMAHREEMISEFQSLDGPSVFVLSLKAGGTGLNLTAANHVIHYDRWWNSAVEAQATDRAFRIGQRKDVVVSKMICEGTLEERIDAIIESKRALAETLISGGETWITELADDEIFDILAFSATALRG